MGNVVEVGSRFATRTSNNILRAESRSYLKIMKLKIAQVIGLNTDQKAAQVSSVEREENTFFTVLELSCDDAFTKGRATLSEIEDFYFEAEGEASEKLNATFSEFEKKLSEECEFSLGLAVISGKVLYLIGRGAIEVYLKREGKLSPLLSVGTSSQIISGFLSEGDKLLLTTKSLVSFLGPDLGKAMDLPVDGFEEEVDSKIGASDLDNQGLAALAVEIEAEIPLQNPEISPLPATEEEKIEEVGHQEFGEDLPKKTRINLKNSLGSVLSLFRRLGSYFPKSGRGRLILAVILIIIIVAGVGYKYKSGRDRAKQMQFNQLFQQAKDDFNAAKGIASLNPAEAKTKLDSAKGQVDKALSLKPKDQEAINFKKQIEQDSASILQQSSVSDFPLFLDMDLVKKNFRATRMSLSGNKLLLLDSGVRTLVTIDLTKKSNQILAGSDQLGDAQQASINGGLAFIYSGDKGILKVDTANQKITTVSKKDNDWGKIVDLYGFAGNVYVLDTGKKEATSGGQIWKYLPTPDGYSAKRNYLNSGVKADFTGALRMQIESSIYVLKSGGEILRFTRGDKDNFSLGGLDKGVKDPKSLFVSSDTDNLYLLDSGNSRLLILTKTGAYKGQIGGAKFATATDLVVDEKNKKVYLLEGSKIYSVDLK